MTSAVGVPTSWHAATGVAAASAATWRSASSRLADAVVHAAARVFIGLAGLAVLRTCCCSCSRASCAAGTAARRHAPGRVARDGPPPVTVIVPAYNEEAGIAATVRSLAASDYPELEVIVVDDGSTDGTADIVARPRPARTYG